MNHDLLVCQVPTHRSTLYLRVTGRKCLKNCLLRRAVRMGCCIWRTLQANCMHKRQGRRSTTDSKYLQLACHSGQTSVFNTFGNMAYQSRLFQVWQRACKRHCWSCLTGPPDSRELCNIALISSLCCRLAGPTSHSMSLQTTSTVASVVC